MSGRSLVFALSGLLVVAPIALRAQTLDSTMALANSAESAGDFSRAMTLYDHAYHLTGFDPGMLAAAAVSAARAGQGERAVDYFRRAVHEGFLDAGFLRFAERDTALATVRLSPLWMGILHDAQHRARLLDTALRAELLGLAARDHQNRERINEVMTRNGRSSPEGASAMAELALLEDRVRVAEGRPQVYGSQMRSAPAGGPPALEPIADEACVDRRRASVGLEPLADYLRRFGVAYSAPTAPCAAEPASTDRAAEPPGVVHLVTVAPATISLVVIVVAISPGTTTIVATSVADATVQGAATVTVRPRPHR
jgi:hypothetical protein